MNIADIATAPSRAERANCSAVIQKPRIQRCQEGELPAASNGTSQNSLCRGTAGSSNRSNRIKAETPNRGLAVGGHRGLRCTIILVTGAKGHRAIPQCPYVPLAHRSGKRVHLCQAHRRIAERPGETICRAHLPSDLRHSSHLAHTAHRHESGRCRLCFEM